MTPSSLPERAVVLTRISDDKAEEAKGVGRQEDDCREKGRRLGWGIGEVIVENDTSAYKRRKVKLPDGTAAMRVVRPGFRRLLELLASGQADALIAYDLDRVARDPRDLEDLIDVVETRGIPVESVTGSLRLSNDADVTMARVLVAVANKSSRDTSRRVARSHQQLAAEGKPGGGGIRPYGYEPDRMTVRESEAEIIRELARRLINGDTYGAIAADLTARKVPTVNGGPWGTRSVRSVVTKPRVAGLRSTGKGAAQQIVGPAAWPAILDMEIWEAACAAAVGRAGYGTTNELKRWLNGSLWCPLCGAPLFGAPGRTAPRYWCSTPRGGCGRIAIDAAGAEAEVERQILEYLADPSIMTRLRSLTDSDASKRARDGLAADEAQLKEMAQAYGQRQFTLAEYVAARKIVDERVRAARALLVASAPRILRALLSENVAEGWGALEPVDRREAVLALVPNGWDVVPFTPVPGQRNTFDPTRLRPRDPATSTN